MKRDLSLSYSISEGDLKPYFDALMRAEALAAKCTACEFVSFPPRSICKTCHGNEREWLDLPGTAKVVHRTDGAEKSFAFVQFSGATTLTAVAIQNPSSDAPTGRLAMPADATPSLWLRLEDTDKGQVDV